MSFYTVDFSSETQWHEPQTVGENTLPFNAICKQISMYYWDLRYFGGIFFFISIIYSSLIEYRCVTALLITITPPTETNLCVYIITAVIAILFSLWDKHITLLQLSRHTPWRRLATSPLALQRLPVTYCFGNVNVSSENSYPEVTVARARVGAKTFRSGEERLLRMRGAVRSSFRQNWFSCAHCCHPLVQ